MNTKQTYSGIQTLRSSDLESRWVQTSLWINTESLYPSFPTLVNNATFHDNEFQMTDLLLNTALIIVDVPCCLVRYNNYNK